MLKKKVKIALGRMAKIDQAARRHAQNTGTRETVKEIDQANTEKLKKIIQRYGWPTTALVGRRGSHAAWLIAQHADRDVRFQEKCLRLMEVAHKKCPDYVEKADIAFLTDRVRVNRGKPQLFGTQFYFKKNGNLALRPVYPKRGLEKRRKDYNLPPLKEYLKLARKRKMPKSTNEG